MISGFDGYRCDSPSPFALRIAIILVMVFRMSRHLSSFDIWQLRSSPFFDNSKYCWRTCSSSVSVCNTYSGEDNFTTFSGLVYFAGVAFTGVEVCRMGDSLMEELPEDFESSWPDSCKKKIMNYCKMQHFFFSLTQNYNAALTAL